MPKCIHKIIFFFIPIVLILFPLKANAIDCSDYQFLSHKYNMCKFGKPVLLSTGASHLHEVQEAVGWIENYNNPLSIMHCVLNYPTPDKNANLGVITYLREKFPRHLIGYSDHTIGNIAVLTAVALGATVIEKHFTLCRADGGVDSVFSLEPEDMKALVIETERAWQSLGEIKYGYSEAENSDIVREVCLSQSAL